MTSRSPLPASRSSKQTIHVAAGVVFNPQGQVLVAKRPPEKHQGGLWEFPGGKIEAGECAHAALARELEEEVGIHTTASEPLIKIQHSYPDKTVCLHVLRVTRFVGIAWGREGQDIAWVEPEELPNLPFPAANTPIVAAARLPQRLMITGAFTNPSDCLQKLEQGLEKQPGMVQFRAPWLEKGEYIRLAREIHTRCRAQGIPLLANCSVKAWQEIACEGLHLTSKAIQNAMKSTANRPLPKNYWVSAACHSREELRQAQILGMDFVLLSPVFPTHTHPGQQALGWKAFEGLANEAVLPVYALGGMDTSHIKQAIGCGAQGIAAIGAYWA